MNWSGSRALVQKLQQSGLKSVLQRYGRGVVVDLGCGDQPYRHYCRCQQYLGVDRSKGEIRGDFFRLKLGSRRADTVICTQVLEHVPDPRRLFKLAYGLLRPRGYLVLTAPFVWPLHDEPHDYWRFSGYGLTQLARETGFKPVRVVPLGGFIALIWQLIAIVLERPVYSKGTFNRIYGFFLRALFRAVQPLIYRLDQKKKLKGATLVYLLVAQKPA